jgi:hypothetical protein
MSDSGWQPIETAPKDGTWFLICNADDGFDSYEVGSYDPEVGSYDPTFWPEYVEVEGGLYRKEMKTSYEWRGFNNLHRATHWMPLPEPPLTAGPKP